MRLAFRREPLAKTLADLKVALPLSYTRKDTRGGQDILRGRFLLYWKPTDTLSFLFSANGWRNKSDTQAAQLVGIKLQQEASAPGLYDPVATLPRIAAFRVYPLAPDMPARPTGMRAVISAATTACISSRCAAISSLAGA